MTNDNKFSERRKHARLPIIHDMGEMRGLILAAGGREETVFGLAGLGDFILTGTSDISRNRRLGEKLGKGKLVAQARSEISTVAEGADSVESVMRARCL